MSGFQGGDFYTPAGMYNGQTANNMRYRSQLAAGMQIDPAGLLSPSTVGKRSLAELHQQQQALFLRSVKQRAQTSPISPLSPISPEISTASSSSSARSFCYPIPPRQQLPPTTSGVNTTSISLAGVNLRQSSPDSKMRNRLIELERQLLDDDENDGSAAASAVTNSEWSETMQSLMVPIPVPPQQKSLSPSPTSSSSSSSSSATTIAASTAKHQLMDAAVAVSEGSIETATAILNRLKQVSGAAGNPDQRLNDYLLQSLLSRLNLNPNPPESSSTSPVAELFGNEHLIATQMLFEASPCFKLGFMAANLAILEATQNQAKIHIIDFEIGQGNQYVTLIHALGERQISSALKITAVSDPSFPLPDGIRAVGDRLTKHADRVGVGFRFNVVCRKVSDLSRETIRHEDGEALAVNFAFRLYKMPDESVSTANPRDELLRSVKSLGPQIVTLVEQEMNANTAPFLTRFNEAQAYYGALFDSLDATMARDGPDRTRVEECLSRKAINSVAREGQDRVERCEVFGKWRARMGMAGFEPKPLSANIAEPLQAKLASARPNPGFFLKEEAGGLFFGWKGRVLTVASAWR